MNGKGLEGQNSGCGVVELVEEEVYLTIIITSTTTQTAPPRRLSESLSGLLYFCPQFSNQRFSSI